VAERLNAPVSKAVYAYRNPLIELDLLSGDKKLGLNFI